MVFVSFCAQNGHAHINAWRLDVGDHTALEPRLYAIFQIGEILWWPVGSDDNLLAGHVERVKRMKKLFLCAVSAGNKLHVVN